MRKIKLSIFLALVTLLLYACSSSQKDEKSGCMPPPQGFSEADLIGTWFHESLGDTDTLIIREDGTYKQILHLESRAFDYESDWQAWRVEYAESGIPYLHLEGLRVCAYFLEMDCEQVGGGEGTWYDFCRDKSVDMSGEGVLMVLKVPDRFQQPPRGIELKLLQKYIEGVWWYELQEPAISTEPPTLSP